MGGCGRSPNRIAWLGQSGSATAQERVVDPSASMRSIVPSTPILSRPPSGSASSCRRYRRPRPWPPVVRPATPASVCVALACIAVAPAAELLREPRRRRRRQTRPRPRPRGPRSPAGPQGGRRCHGCPRRARQARLGRRACRRSIGRWADRRRSSRHCTRRCSRRARRRRYGPQEGIRSVARFGPAKESPAQWRLRHLRSALGPIPSNEVDQGPSLAGVAAPEGVGRARTTRSPGKGAGVVVVGYDRMAHR